MRSESEVKAEYDRMTVDLWKLVDIDKPEMLESHLIRMDVLSWVLHYESAATGAPVSDYFEPAEVMTPAPPENASDKPTAPPEGTSRPWSLMKDAIALNSIDPTPPEPLDTAVLHLREFYKNL